MAKRGTILNDVWKCRVPRNTEKAVNELGANLKVYKVGSYRKDNYSSTIICLLTDGEGALTLFTLGHKPFNRHPISGAGFGKWKYEVPEGALKHRLKKTEKRQINHKVIK